MSTEHSEEIRRGERFQFGANWTQFLGTLNDERVSEAEQSLRDMLGVSDLKGRRFLDIGSGSGLFSLAARRLGAEVHSFDYDPKSVECGQELRRRYFPEDPDWIVEEGSALDADYVTSLGQFDYVYSWGVLHHTGDMETALRNASLPVKDGGVLFVAIYNDQDVNSAVWKAVKKTFCSGRVGRAIVSSTYVPYFAAQSVAIGLVKFGSPLGMFENYKQRRGMSIYHDWIDWLGGYPFEVARPEEIFHIYKEEGFVLENLITTNRMGCNEFVFRKATKSVAKKAKVKAKVKASTANGSKTNGRANGARTSSSAKPVAKSVSTDKASTGAVRKRASARKGATKKKSTEAASK